MKLFKKKHFYIKHRYLWHIIDIAVLIGCFFIADKIWGFAGIPLSSFFSLIGEGLSLLTGIHGLFSKLAFFTVLMLFLVVLFILVLLVTFPVLGIYYGVSKALKKNQLSRVRYDVIADIDYFREGWNTLSAADISLLMNLKLERKKDVTATLLALELKNYIRLQNNRIELLCQSTQPLLPSEAELLQIIRANSFNPLSLNRWEQVSAQFAVRNGLLTYNKDKARFLLKLLSFAAAFFVCAASFANLIMTSEEKDARIDALLAPYSGTYDVDYDALTHDEQMALLQEQLEIPAFRQSIALLSGMMLGLLCGIMLFIIPFIIIAYVISYLASKPRYKRTRKGKILTEEIAGMKNFIHDFSNLSEADKNHLVLWDYFLVYAVVLEENESIINEIGHIRKVDVTKYNRPC